jgi:hypothetical protein
VHGQARNIRLTVALSFAAIAVLLSGCGASVAVYHDDHLERIRHRVVAVVDSTPQAPLDEQKLRAILDRMEARVAASPRIRRILKRRELAELAGTDFRIRNDYQVFADTWSTVGVVDRELAIRLGKFFGADILLNMQAYQVPCAFCVDGNSAYLIAQVVDASTGFVALRINTRTHPAATEQALADAFGEMEEEVMTEIAFALTPRAHLERFRNLAVRRNS